MTVLESHGLPGVKFDSYEDYRDKRNLVVDEEAIRVEGEEGKREFGGALTWSEGGFLRTRKDGKMFDDETSRTADGSEGKRKGARMRMRTPLGDASRRARSVATLLARRRTSSLIVNAIANERRRRRRRYGSLQENARAREDRCD